MKPRVRLCRGASRSANEKDQWQLGQARAGVETIGILFPMREAYYYSATVQRG